jgi:hypothetical protein
LTSGLRHLITIAERTTKVMRITFTLDDALCEEALALATPGMDQADLFWEAIKIFINVQAAKRLAALGSKAPEMDDISWEREDSS